MSSITQNITNGWEKIIVASGSSPSVQFTNIPTNLSSFSLIMYNVVTTTLNANIILQFSSSNGSSYITTGYNSSFFYYGPGTGVTIVSNGILIHTTMTAVTQVINANFCITNLNSAGSSAGLSGTSMRADKYGASFGGLLSSVSAINSFQILATVGNIVGNFKLYGLN